MSLDNCKRCGRLFQKHLTSLCKDCYSFEQNQNMEIYRFVQANPGITIDEIAEHFGMNLRDVEQLVFSGALGTANQLIKTQCARCKCEMTFVNRIGYFCYSCNKFIEKEAGKISETEKKLDNIMKGHSAFYKPLTPEEEEELKRALAKSKPADKSEPQKTTTDKNKSMVAKYGFKRISGSPSPKRY